MRFVLGVLLWVGLFATVREWRYARKHHLAITLAEKLLLASALPLGVVAQLAVELAGVTTEVELSWRSCFARCSMDGPSSGGFSGEVRWVCNRYNYHW